jgi:nitroimidazol reductase NimA-like FMN-containing flavoprotein (pyridoxamine 5'-phosphate oxidase superfamily)
MAHPTDPDVLVPAGPRSQLRRKRERGDHRRRTIDAILDEGLLCHVGFSTGGQTFVQPMAYARIDDVLYLHGAPANRLLGELATGVDACVEVTLLDALVLARSAFHHSMNYRSVMLFGTCTRVTDRAEQERAVVALLEHMAPGRSADARLPTTAELRATLIVRFPIGEGSAKVRTGGPIDDEEDMDLEIWAGEIPFELVAQPAVGDPDLVPGVEEPEYARAYPGRRR